MDPKFIVQSDVNLNEFTHDENKMEKRT